MTDKAEAAERAAFEAAMIERGYPIRLYTDGMYMGMNSYRWEGWQACAALKAQPAPMIIVHANLKDDGTDQTENLQRAVDLAESLSQPAPTEAAQCDAVIPASVAQGEDSARLEWISVDDQLPKEFWPVLAQGAKRLEFAVMRYTEKDGWEVETTGDRWASYPPKYWMELPAAPQPQEQK